MNIEQDLSKPIASPNIHPDYNFEDGNIILSVTGKVLPKDPNSLDAEQECRRTKETRTYLFRVHKSILKKNSQTFADMLALSEDGGSATLVDGLPIVPLQDEPLELIRLLQVIYYSDSVPHEPFMRNTFNYFTSVLKLADKYDMPRLTEKFVSRLLSEWPRELREWDAIQDRIATLISNSIAYGGDPDDFLVDPATVIRFGVDYSCPDILPSAYYALLTMPPYKFSEQEEMRERWFYACGGRIPRYDLLGPQELLTLYTGSISIRHWIGTFIKGSEFGLGDDRTEALEDMQDDHWQCTEIKKWWLEHVDPLIRNWLTSGALDPLHDIRRLMPNNSLCPTCRPWVCEILESSRADFWANLPGFFDVKPKKWDVHHGQSQWKYMESIL